MFIVKRFLKPHKRPKQFWKFEFKIPKPFFDDNALDSMIPNKYHLDWSHQIRCWWRMLVTTSVDDRLSPRWRCHQHHFRPISNSFLFPKNWAHLEIQLDIYLLACVVCERDNNLKWQLFLVLNFWYGQIDTDCNH